MNDTTTDEPSATWGQWLQTRLAEKGWSQADLVRESGGLIRRDRASKWARGMERPTHRSAIVVANVLGRDHDEVLRAAGFDVDPSRDETSAGSAPQALVARLDDYTEIELLDELLRRATARDGRDARVTRLNPTNVGRLDDAEVASRESIQAALQRPIAAKRGKRKGDEELGAD